jgi:arylsulfatase A-like enzyme
MVDLVPTVAELADLELRHTHFGRSLLPLLADEDAAHRTHAFAEAGFTIEEEPLLERAPWPYDIKAGMQHEDPLIAGKAVAVRTAEWAYVWRLYEPPELYDRVGDTGELVNRAGDPDVAEVEADLRDTVLRWMVETADVVPWEEDPRRPVVELPVPGQGRR